MKQNTSIRNFAQTDDLSFDMLRRLNAAKPNEDVSVCGLGLSTCLAMVANGTRGATYDGLLKSIYQSGNLERLNIGYANLLAELNGGKLGVDLKIANAVYAADSVPFRPDFLTRVRESYNADVRNRNFADAQRVLNHESDVESERGINPWVREFTGGRIKQILKELDANSIMVLLTALSFEAAWTSKFKIHYTNVAKFYGVEGEADHEIMNQTGRFLYTETNDFQFVAMPFGENRRVVKYVLLPKPGKSIKDVLSGLSRSSFWSLGRDVEPTVGHLYLPRYKTETEAELNEPLQQMGAALAFGGGDFGNLADGNIKISKVIQKNVGTFHELGGRVDSVTAVNVGFEACVRPTVNWEFRADRPFVAVLADTVTGGIILANVVNKPQRAPEPKE